MNIARSMTAYGRAVGHAEGKDITVEIKSVNGRFFDPTIKVSRAFSYLEEKIKAYIQTFISRGKVDVWVGIDVTENVGCEIALDGEYARQYISALRSLRDSFGLTDDISVMTVAANKDLFTFKKPEEDTEHIWNEILPFLEEAKASFTAMRIAEGANLCRDLEEKKENIRKMTAVIAKKSEQCTLSYRDKLETRIKQLLDDHGVTVDENRLLTECAIYADKIAVDEELVRLSSHFDAFDGIIASEGPVGKKLDFLVQEMNRETNTIGSKCSDADIAHVVIDIKNELEKIREQVQNLE